MTKHELIEELKNVDDDATICCINKSAADVEDETEGEQIYQVVDRFINGFNITFLECF